MENAGNQSRLAVSTCIQIALAVLRSGYKVPGTDCGCLRARTTQSVYSQHLTPQTFYHFTKLLRYTEVDAYGVYIMPSTD